MSTPRSIINQDYKDRVQAHPLTVRLRGEIVHATTLSNALSIFDDGCIRVETSRNGIHPCAEDAQPSACRAIGAVSVFDFAVPDDQLYWVQWLHSDVHEYVMHWWSFLTRHPNSVIFLLDDAVRARFASDSERGQIRQLIAGTERCHVGDIDTSHIAGCLLLNDAGETTSHFAPDAVAELRREILALLAPATDGSDELDPAAQEHILRIRQLLGSDRQTQPGPA